MAMSVNTNKSALIALQNLNSTNEKLEQVQNKINTGLRVANAKDNAAVYAIAQKQRADFSSLGAVKMSLDRATSITDVALSAGQQISDILVQMREKVVGAAEEATHSLYETDLQGPLALVLGAEGAGLRQLTRRPEPHVSPCRSGSPGIQ